MKFSKYILACGCLCNVGFAAYAGEDAAITELRESIESLKSQVTALKAKDEAIEEQNQTFDKSLEGIKTQVTETSQKLDTISQKIESTQAPNSTKGEEDDRINTRLGNLETSIQEMKTSIPSSEEIAEIKSSLTQVNASITNLTQEIDAQKSINEQQSLDLGKNEARIDKIERANTMSSVANVAGGLLGSALQGGFGLLSQKLNANSLKESIAKGDSTEELTKNMTPEEQLELEEIKQEITLGKTDKEIQERLDALKSKVAAREEKERKFPETIFYGIDPFDNSTILHLLNLGRNGEKIDPNVFLENIETSKKITVDYIKTMTDYINIIYDWGQKGAKLQDIMKNIKVISSGSPKKVVKSELLKQATENQLIVAKGSQAMQQSRAMNRLVNVVGDVASRDISGDNQISQNAISSGQYQFMNQNSENQSVSYETPVQEESSSIQNHIVQQSNDSMNSMIESQSQQNLGAQISSISQRVNDGNTIDQHNDVRFARNTSRIENINQLNNQLSNPQVMRGNNEIDQLQVAEIPMRVNPSEYNQAAIQNNRENVSEVVQNVVPNNQRTVSGFQMNSNNLTSNQLVDSQITENRVLTEHLPNDQVLRNDIPLTGTQSRQSSMMQQTNSRTSSITSGNRIEQTQERLIVVPQSTSNITTVDQSGLGQNVSSMSVGNRITSTQERQVIIPQSTSNVTTVSQSGLGRSVNGIVSENRNGSYSEASNSLNQTRRSETGVQRPQNEQSNQSTGLNQGSSTIANSLSSEPDTFDMTVMDIDDNNYYDVTKKKFMRIAKPSSKFPKTIVTQSNVKINPIDTFAVQRVEKLSR